MAASAAADAMATGLQAAAAWPPAVRAAAEVAASSSPSSEWTDDDFDVLADGAVVGRIMKVHAAPEGSPWMWTLAFGHHEDRQPTYGYELTREAS